MYVWVRACENVCPLRSEVSDAPRAAPYDCWEPPSLGPLQEWYVLLTAESDLRLKHKLLKAKYWSLNEIAMVAAPNLPECSIFNHETFLSPASFPRQLCGLLLIS